MTTPTSNPSTSATDPAAQPFDADSPLAREAGRPIQAPAFFDEVPRIRMRDPLADILGAAEGGLMEYAYAEAVKLAGHSCPTVAGAWLMTRAALGHLYGGATPVRGEVRVELREAQEAGATGVVASVAGLITGAAGAGGFMGLAGRHGRRDLLEFDKPIAGQMRFTRLDNGRSVCVSLHAEVVPRPPGLSTLLQGALAANADAAAREAFARAWQGWVRAMLIDHADDPSLVVVED